MNTLIKNRIQFGIGFFLFAFFSCNFLHAGGYTWWHDGDGSASLLPIAGQEGTLWTTNNYGTHQFFLGYMNNSGATSATLGKNEVFDTRKTSTNWPITINNGSFVIGRYNNLQPTLTLSDNAKMYIGTNFWVMYGEGANANTYASTIGTFNMSGTSSLWVEGNFNIAGQNYNQGVVNLSGNATIEANEFMNFVGVTKTNATVTMSGNSSITTRSTFRFVATDNVFTLKDNAKIESKGDVIINNNANVTLNGSAKMDITKLLQVGTLTNSNVTLTLGENSSIIADGVGEYHFASGKGSTVNLKIADNATFVVGVNGKPSDTKPRTADGDGSKFTLTQTGGRSVWYGRTCFGEGEQASTGSNTTVNLSGGTLTTNACIVGSHDKAVINLSGDSTLNNWGRFIINYYNDFAEVGIINQTGGTANIWANNSHWNDATKSAVGITFGYNNLNTAILPGQYNISAGVLNTYGIRNFNKYTTTSHAATDSLLNISGDAELNIIYQENMTGSGVLAVPTSMTGGTLNVYEIQTAQMANNTFYQQGGILSPDGGTAICPTSYTNTTPGAETYEIDELMGFTKGTSHASTKITGNYKIETVDKDISIAEIRLDTDNEGNFDTINVTGKMEIDDNVILSIYLADNETSLRASNLITADGGITGTFSELNIFDAVGELLFSNPSALIYGTNSVSLDVDNIPEPATWVLLAIGLVGGFFLRKRNCEKI